MKHLFIALLLVLAVAPAVGVAQSNETGNQTVEISVETPPEAREVIDNSTALLGKTVEGGRMVLIIQSDVTQRVTLTDAGSAWEGGEVTQRKVWLREGRNKVEIPVTEISGRVVVTVSTREVLYSIPVSTGSNLITGPYGAADVRNSALGGLVAGLGVTALLAVRRVRGVSDAPERLL
jgi:hypothetical protein